MPFKLPFHFPYFFGPNYRYTYNNPYISNSKPIPKKENTTKEEDSTDREIPRSDESSEYFFEIFGLRLYFDDILIICILYFLYTEGVQDQELFLCLILLLLS